MIKPLLPAMNKNVEIIPFSSTDILAETVAGQWLDEIAAARSRGVPHTVALSGGRITLKLFAAVVAQSRARGLSFGHVHFFWADERCVPPTDAESNFKAAAELLFAPLNIASGQIHRLKGEDDPETTARAASAELLSVAPANAAGQPVLDLVILGMGEDGHVASLFPGAGAEVLNCTTPFLVIRNSPKPPPTRITLSYAAIAAARHNWVLAAGTGKEKALHDTLTLRQTPLGRVITAHPGVKIFTDIKISV